MRLRRTFVASSFLIAAWAVTAHAASLPQVLSVMDAQAAKFSGIQANFKRTTYTDVIKDTSVESGEFVMRRAKGKQVQALMNTITPEPKSVSFHDRKVELYYPKAAEIQEVDLGKQANLVDQFLLLGFGSSGKELQSGYDIKFHGDETIDGKQAARLELTPKSGDVKKHLTKVELWVDAAGGYPVQQKFYRPSGDYTLMNFSDVKLNPALAADAVSLKTPKGVKRVKQ